MGLLTKDQILKNRDNRKTAIVDTPEWGGSVLIIELSGRERDDYESELIQISGVGKKATQKLNTRNIRAKLVARCVVNPDDFDLHEANGMVISAVLKPGKTPTRMFNSSVDVENLGDVSGAALDRVFEKCQTLSGIRDEDIEELVGELKNDLSADSGIG